MKQQIWMALHLPFHLAILGVIEGSQQLAQARYIYYNTQILFTKAWYGCVGQHLDGQVLASNLTKNIDYFKINESARGTLALHYVWKEIAILGNTTDVCSSANTTNVSQELFGLPLTFAQFFNRAMGAMFQAFDMDIPPEDDANSSLHVALRSWIVVYTYFWSAIILLLVCYTITALLAEVDERGHWRSISRYANLSIVLRAAMIVLAAVMLALGVISRPYYYFVQYYIASSWILPTVVLAFWVICVGDRLEKLWVRRMIGKTKYESVAAVDGEGGETQEMGGVRRRGTNAYGYPSH
jgi:small-conductance mechanosensitive channel